MGSILSLSTVCPLTIICVPSRGLKGYLFEGFDLVLGLVAIPFLLFFSITEALVLLCFLEVDDLMSKGFVSRTGGTRIP